MACPKCGWVHFGVTFAEALVEISRFNAFYDTAAPETQEHFAGRSSIENYSKCFNCGAGWETMQEARPGRRLDGVTLQPILIRGPGGN